MGISATLRPPHPVTRREWRILSLFGIVGITQGWAGSAVTHALPFVQTEFALSDARVFDVMAIVRAVALVAIVLSWWSDHHGRRRPLLIALLILTAGNLATGLTASLASFVALQSVARIGTIAVGALAIVVLAEEVAPAIRGYAIALYSLLGSMGTGVGLLLRPLADAGPTAWRLLFLLSSAPILVIPFLTRSLGESRAFTPPLRRQRLTAVLGPAHAGRFWRMAALSFALSAFSSPVANLALIRLENGLAWSTGAASLMLVLSSTPGVILGLLIGGRLADTVGRRPTQAIAIGVGVIGGVAFYSVEGWLLGVAMFLATLGGSAFAPAYASHRSELFPTEIRSTAAAWLVNAAIAGGLIGFAAGRFAVDAWGLSVTIGVLGVALALAATALVGLPETKGLTIHERAAGTDPPTGAIPV